MRLSVNQDGIIRTHFDQVGFVVDDGCVLHLRPLVESLSPRAFPGPKSLPAGARTAARGGRNTERVLAPVVREQCCDNRGDLFILGRTALFHRKALVEKRGIEMSADETGAFEQFLMKRN